MKTWRRKFHMMKKYFHGTGGMTSEEAGEMSEKLYFA